MDHHIVSTPLLILKALFVGALVYVGNSLPKVTNIHIPPIVIESLQTLSYLGGFTISCITAYNFFQKRRKK
jgi:hypothetical protein